MKQLQTDAIHLPIPDMYLAEVRFDNTRETGTFIVEHMEIYEGDLVYVTGPMQDKVGTVIDVTYHCKIRPSKYERVVAKIDTDLYGNFIPLEHMWVTFDHQCMNKDKMRLWFLSPMTDGECVDSNGFAPFGLHELDSFPISDIRAERGESYYEEHRVVYICLDKGKGYAIVQGSEYYEVTFTYIDNKIHDILCNCYCEGHCKHEYAVLLQLQDVIGHWLMDYNSNYSESEYMAAIDKTVVWNMSVSRKYGEIIKLTEESYEGLIIYED